MSPLGTLLVSALLLPGLALAALASRPATSRPRSACGASVLLALATGAAALALLIAAGEPARLVLPVGLPWLGLHLRLGTLSAFFLLPLGTGGTIASLFAPGCGADEREPDRILPFYPGLPAAMVMVRLTDDAFGCLFF